ncbi:MAG: hypothetical protein Q8L23_02155 [Caulobacter sp.]|jgi:hypothetical protein|nr:hypothetical protein [Caulobacter sp.]
MDPFVATGLFAIGLAALVVPVFLWLLPKLDRAAGRLSDYLDARKAR